MTESPSARALHIEYLGRRPISDAAAEAILDIINAEAFVESMLDGPDSWDQKHGTSDA